MLCRPSRWAVCFHVLLHRSTRQWWKCQHAFNNSSEEIYHCLLWHLKQAWYYFWRYANFTALVLSPMVSVILKIFTWKNIYIVNSDHQWWVDKEYLLSNLLQFFCWLLHWDSDSLQYTILCMYADISPFWKLIVVSLTNTCTFTLSGGYWGH